MVAAVIHLPDDLHEQLQRLAAERGVTVSDVLRESAETLVKRRQASQARPTPLPTIDLGEPRPHDVEGLRELANPAAEWQLPELDQR